MKLDPKRLRSWALDALVIVAILVGVHLYTTRAVACGAAPELSGMDLSGRALSLRELRGQPVLVHFWATWCPVCRQEESSIASLARDHRVLTVATSSGSSADVARYLAQRHVSLPALADADGSLAARYGVDRFPSSFIVDARGRIRFVEVGYTTSIGLRLRMWLAGL